MKRDDNYNDVFFYELKKKEKKKKKTIMMFKPIWQLGFDHSDNVWEHPENLHFFQSLEFKGLFG